MYVNMVNWKVSNDNIVTFLCREIKSKNIILQYSKWNNLKL